MKTVIVLFLQSAATVFAFTLSSSDVEALFPSASPTAKSDDWECATHDYKELLDPPKPTGSLADSLETYNAQVFEEPCTVSGVDRLDCPLVGYPEICGFSTAAPDDLLTAAYSSHASSASSWWAAHSSSALEVASECPHYWYEAARGTFLASAWLNQTIAYAQCYDDAGITGAKTTEMEPTATSGSGVTGDVPEETGESNNGVEHSGMVDMLIVAACSLVAATLNAL